MRTFFTLFLLTIFCNFNVQAQKVVALHSPTNGVQFFNSDIAFQDAYDAAIAGDTIYLPGGTHFPPSIFEKQLTIFGAGHNPNATTATFPTLISGNFIMGDNADGFYLEGVQINGNLYVGNASNIPVENITVKRCRWNTTYAQGDGVTPSQNNIFIENVINNIYDIRNMRSCTFMNNIFEGTLGYNLISLSFLNNVFNYSYPGSSTAQVISYANGCLFKNNIFLQESNDVCEGNGTSTWINNIFCTSTTTPLLGLDPVLVNNYFMARANVLVNQTGNAFDYTHDYHLQAAAAANLGDDGLETGIYGGFYPWKDYSIPINPHISSKTISGSSDTNGMIQLDINVHAQNN